MNNVIKAFALHVFGRRIDNGRSKTVKLQKQLSEINKQLTETFDNLAKVEHRLLRVQSRLLQTRCPDGSKTGLSSCQSPGIGRFYKQSQPTPESYSDNPYVRAVLDEL